MHTIGSLRRTLDLSTTNQVRNRIDAIKDVLADALRRGPNNQILVTDEGVDLLRQLQDLYDSGLTMAEASAVLRAKLHRNDVTSPGVSAGFPSLDTKPHETSSLVNLLRDEIAFLRERVAQLETQLRAEGNDPAAETGAWWQRLREDLDGS
jgi:hypothetical protein